MDRWEDMTRAERQEMVSDVTITTPQRQLTNVEAIAKFRSAKKVAAVDKEIKKDPRIKGKEAKLIHALLKGRAR